MHRERWRLNIFWALKGIKRAHEILMSTKQSHDNLAQIKMRQSTACFLILLVGVQIYSASAGYSRTKIYDDEVVVSW